MTTPDPAQPRQAAPPVQAQTVPAHALRFKRAVAGEKAGHKWRGLEVVVLAALVGLIGGGAAVASANVKDNDGAAVTASPVAAPAEVLNLGYVGNITTGPVSGAWVAEPWTSPLVLQAGAVINKALTVVIGQPLEDDEVARSLSELKFTADPLAATFPTLLENGIFELTLLNKALKATGGQPVPAAGLGTE